MLARHIEWMSDAHSRSQGLLKYSSAPDSYAAVFHLALRGFFPAIHTFGMKFSIDVVYCDQERHVVAIYRNIGPGRFVCPWKFVLGGCRYLVEFSNGDLNQLSLGDRLEWVDG